VAEPFRPEPTGRQETEVLPDDLFTKEPPPRPARSLDLVALVAGTVFVVLAIALMAGVTVPADWWDRDLGWLVLIAAGVALLVNELRKSRRKR
jgi:fatty acid desaturase